MTRPPVSYPAAALYGLDADRDPSDALEEYERAEDDAREREELEEEADADLDFTHPCPLKEIPE